MADNEEFPTTRVAQNNLGDASVAAAQKIIRGPRPDNRQVEATLRDVRKLMDHAGITSVANQVSDTAEGLGKDIANAGSKISAPVTKAARKITDVVKMYYETSMIGILLKENQNAQDPQVLSNDPPNHGLQQRATPKGPPQR